MAVKSVIEVDVKDEAFKTFVDLFNKYKEEVAKMPEDWAKVGDEVKNTGVHFGDLVAAMVAQSLLLKKMEENQEKNTHEVVKQEGSWKKIKGYTKDVSDNITSAAKSLLRWTSATGFLTGIVGAGGLYGIDSLAHSVANQRKYSLGIGTTYGGEKAFSADYGRFVDPERFLGGVNQATHDLTQRYALLSLGLSQQALNKGDTAEIGSDLILKLKDLADRTNPALYQQAIDARGLGGITSINDLERLHSLSRGEVVDQAKHFGDDTKAFGLDAVTQRKWTDFSNQLTRAGQKIEKVFIDGLTPLATPLEHLSDSIVKVLTNLLKWADKSGAIDKLGIGLEHFASYLISDDFGKKVKEFEDDVGALGGAIHKTLVLLGLSKAPTDDNGKPLSKNPNMEGNVFQKLKGTIQDENPGYGQQKAPWTAAKDSALQALEKFYSLPPGTLSGVYSAESNKGKNSGPSSAGALGPFQFMPATAKQYGVTDLKSFSQESKAAGKYLADLSKKYGGDVTKALAAYNWGPGNLDKDIKKHGADWRKFIPKETADYINKVQGSSAPVVSGDDTIKKLAAAINKPSQPSATIVVQNNTGGNATITSNQATY